MKDHVRQNFRWAPHTSGAAQARPRDYQEPKEFASTGWWALWDQLKEGPDALEVGDILENPEGELRIVKYVGMEPAAWILIEKAAPAPEGGALQASLPAVVMAPASA
jgi:hypothetical protein